MRSGVSRKSGQKASIKEYAARQLSYPTKGARFVNPFVPCSLMALPLDVSPYFLIAAINFGMDMLVAMPCATPLSAAAFSANLQKESAPEVAEDANMLSESTKEAKRHASLSGARHNLIGTESASRAT